MKPMQISQFKHLLATKDSDYFVLQRLLNLLSDARRRELMRRDVGHAYKFSPIVNERKTFHRHCIKLNFILFQHTNFV